MADSVPPSNQPRSQIESLLALVLREVGKIRARIGERMSAAREAYEAEMARAERTGIDNKHEARMEILTSTLMFRRVADRRRHSLMEMMQACFLSQIAKTQFLY